MPPVSKLLFSSAMHMVAQADLHRDSTWLPDEETLPAEIDTWSRGMGSDAASSWNKCLASIDAPARHSRTANVRNHAKCAPFKDRTHIHALFEIHQHTLQCTLALMCAQTSHCRPGSCPRRRLSVSARRAHRARALAAVGCFISSGVHLLFVRIAGAVPTRSRTPPVS
eukprot:3321238-Pleurochrysis_carterae.AAC.1